MLIFFHTLVNAKLTEMSKYKIIPQFILNHKLNKNPVTRVFNITNKTLPLSSYPHNSVLKNHNLNC